MNDEITTEAKSSSSLPSNASYWEHAKSLAELVFSHAMRYKLHQKYIASSKRDSGSGKVYSSIKNIKALCIKGKILICVVECRRHDGAINE